MPSIHAVPIIFIVVGLILIVFARRVSSAKSNAWARFYKSHAKAAEINPLSHHAGTERSIKLGAMLWRLIGLLLVLIGLLRFSTG